jgi:hypothetical protein
MAMVEAAKAAIDKKIAEQTSVEKQSASLSAFAKKIAGKQAAAAAQAVTTGAVKAPKVRKPYDSPVDSDGLNWLGNVLAFD